MAESINLYQDVESKGKSKGRPFDYVLAIVVTILIAILAGYGYVFWKSTSLTAQIQDTTQRMESMANSLDGENLKEVNDAYLRLEAMEAASRVGAGLALSHLAVIERAIIPEVVVTEYAYGGEDGDLASNAISITISASFLDGISKQITAFRKLSGVESVNVTSMNFEEGEMMANVVLYVGENESASE